MFQPNPILAADFYKVGHVFQYPKNTQVIYSNFTARSGKHFEQSTGIKTDGVVFWKLQGVLQEITDMFDAHFFGQPKNEVLEETIRRLITEVYPSGVVSIVSDTWDFWKTITVHAASLKDEILNRQPNAQGLAKVVFRPDSGYPPDIICGCPEGTSEAAQKGALECLWETFGGTYTSTGHRVLNQRVGLIYGDSITLKLAKEILERMDAMGFASCNIVFGIGSYTYQYITRDTFGMAMKATWALIDEKEHILFKDPVTDSGVKKSARGRLVVTKSEFDNKYMLVDNLTVSEHYDLLNKDEMKLVFLNGKMYNKTSLHKIRELAKESL